MKKYYPPIRMLHLYTGLFISPFVLIFSISALLFNHPGLIKKNDEVQSLQDVKTRLNKIPYDTSDLGTARNIVEILKIKGEIEFISKSDSFFSFPVSRPGIRTNIKVNRKTDSVFVTSKTEGLLTATTYLHSMPGPHNVNLRANSGFMKIWKIFADTVVYIILFLTVSGIFLWYILKAERTLGIYAIVLGMVSFLALMLLIFQLNDK